MMKFKLSLAILVIVFSTISAFYYIFSINIEGDVKELTKYKLTQNALLVQETIDKTKINNEFQLKEWALSNKIGEDIEDLNELYDEKKVVVTKLEEKLKELKAFKASQKEAKASPKAQNSPSLEEQVKTLEEEVKAVENNINLAIASLKNRFDSLTKSLNMNFYYLISKHLSKNEEMTANFMTSDEFIKYVEAGHADSDIWMRKNFLYHVYGVPIKLNGKVVGSLFVGLKKTKRHADFLSEKITTNVSYVNNNKVLSTNIDNTALKNTLNRYITKNKAELKTLSYNDNSEILELHASGKNYMAVFIPLKSYSNKVSGIFISTQVTTSMISATKAIKYWLPIFATFIFVSILILIIVINKSFLSPYVELELETNKYLDDTDYDISPSELGEAEGLARSIKRLIKRAKGEKETTTSSWDDPLFITELNMDDISDKKKTKEHYNEVYEQFIREHINKALPYEHIDKEEFKTRLKTIEVRLKKKFNVKEIYFEVLVDDTGVIKLHPKIIK